MRKNTNKATYEIGDVFVVRCQSHGFDNIPVIPIEEFSDTLNLKEGILLSCTDKKDVNGTEFYIMEIVTGSKSGDSVLIAESFKDFLEKVPSYKRR